MKKSELLKLIFQKTFLFFEKHGFTPNAKRDKWTRIDERFIDQFEIVLGPGFGSGLNHHVRISFTERRVSELFKDVESVIRIAMDSVPYEKLRPTASVSDWKDIIGPQRGDNYVWFCNSERMLSDPDFSGRYFELITLGVKWFELLRNYDHLKAANFQRGLTIPMENYLVTVKIFEPDELLREYRNLILRNEQWKGWDRREVELFFHELMVVRSA